MLDKLVSPVQSAFVPGRKRVDNAIIVQEIIHTINKKKGRVGYMAIKVDLEKAYDKLEWSFIWETLLKENLHKGLVDLIMNCVTSTTTSVLFNGGNLESFWPSQGIQQGDPLSLYIFILSMEVVDHLIEEKCRDKKWIPVKASRSSIASSHLFFADNLVLFARANGSNYLAIRDALDEFCTRFSQSISEGKSKVIFSLNVDRDTWESLYDILGFSSTPNLVKYLGFPIRHRGSSSQDFNFVLERVKQKLAGWKANLLSFAGRTILVQASSSTIPAYIMQCNALPGNLLENIDGVNRNFLWGSSKSVKKIH